jgi:hypothetical protein
LRLAAVSLFLLEICCSRGGATMKTRTEQRDELLTGLGMLIDPIRRLLFGDDDPGPRIPYVRSQFTNDLDAFRTEAINFCRPGKHRFETELNVILRAVNDFHGIFGAIQYPENVAHARTQFPQLVTAAQKAIQAVPCDDPGAILPAQSPYSTYLHLRSICRGASTRLGLFDPYLDAEAFHRYLNTIPDGVRLVIVTSSDIMDLPSGSSPTSGKALRRDRIVAVSELLASQFPDRYEFRVSTEQHDRHIRVDGTILHLGGSAKDAAKQDYFTISNLDPIQSTHAFLDGIIARATEWYGPLVKPHRRS